MVGAVPARDRTGGGDGASSGLQSKTREIAAEARLVSSNGFVIVNAVADIGNFCAYMDVKWLRKTNSITQYHAYRKSLTLMQSRHSHSSGSHLDGSLLSDDQRRRWKTTFFRSIVLFVDGVPDRRLQWW